MQKLLSSKDRLEKIVADIIFDMATKDRLQNGRGKCIVGIWEYLSGMQYYELFQSHGLTKCAIITSYEPHTSDIKGESTGEDEPTENIRKYEIYEKMLGGKDVEVFEDEVKKKLSKNQRR